MRWAAAALAALLLAGCADPRLKDNDAAASAFLAANAKQPGVVTLPDGLQYKVLRSGPAGGASPGPSRYVRVNYEGRLLNGQVFDSSYQHGQPATFQVGGLIPAWTEALQKMKPGDAWMLYAPPALAYGDQGAGPIPPGSVLIFKLELLSVLPGAPAGGG